MPISDDCLITNDWWLLLKMCLMTVLWLLMVAWWLPHDWLMPGFWLIDECLMTAWWLFCDWLMAAWWLFMTDWWVFDDHYLAGDCQITIQSLKNNQLSFFAICTLETLQDFWIKLDIKPLMHLLKISIFSLNNVSLRLTKIMNRADKNWAHF